MSMRDLSTIGIRQTDVGLYGEQLSREGSLNYEKTNYGGPFFELDLLVFSRFIDQLRHAKTEGKPLQRHIDVGTGPNLMPAIISAPYANEFISIEKNPRNTERINELAHGPDELPAHWKAWKDVSAVLYGIGSAEQLDSLSKNESVLATTAKGTPLTGPEIFEALKNWGITEERLVELDKDRQHSGRTSAKIVPEDVKKTIFKQFVGPDNPYINLNLKERLNQTVRTVEGDLFEGVAALRYYEGTANILSKFYVTESITDDRRAFAHGEVNFMKLGVDKGAPKKNAEIFTAHDEKTVAYDTFFTNEEMQDNPHATLKELRATRGFFATIMKPMIDFPPDFPQGDIIQVSTEGRSGFRDDTGIAVVSGTVNYKNPDGTDKFNTGLELLTYTLPDIEHTHHQLEFAKKESQHAVQDVRQYADDFVKKVGLLGNDSINWDRLSQNFWNKYSEINFDHPIPGDIESLFNFIQSVRQKKDGVFIDIGTGATPQFALVAAAFGMKKIIISDYAEGAVKWLNDELLDSHPLSTRSEMWMDIAKLLSTFKDKEQLLSYCHTTGFDKDLRNWQHLSNKDKEYWFNDRRYLTEHSQGASPKESLLDYKGDIKAHIRALHEKGDFEIRKFSILNPPKDLLGKGDIVGQFSVASCMTQKPSEYCQTLLNSCRMARPSGIVCSTYTPYDNWKQYTAEAGDLPSLPRHNHYYSVSHSLVLKEDNGQCGASYDNSSIAKEIANTKSLHKDGVITFEGENGAVSLRRPGDNRFEHLIDISGTPKDALFKDAAEMLGVFQIQMLQKAKNFLMEHPNKKALIVDPTLFRNVGQLEEQLGMRTQYMPLPESLSERRSRMAHRIDGIMQHLENKRSTTDVATLDKQDQAINQFVDNVYERLVGRNAQIKMITNVPPFVARQ